MGVSRRRVLISAACCIGLGVATTVAVAWIAAIGLRVRHTDRYAAGVTSIDWAGWMIMAYGKPGAQLLIASTRNANEAWPAGVRDTLIDAGETDWPPFDSTHPASRPAGEKIVSARGWPWLALWCETPVVPAPGASAGTTIEGGIALPPRQPSNGWKFVASEFRALPLRPMWGGFLLDTGLYAALWGLVAVARARARRAAPCLDRRGLLLAPAACVALGMVTTVAVVAGCVLWVDENAEPYTAADGWGNSKNGQLDWSVFRSAEPGAMRLRSTVIHGSVNHMGGMWNGPAEQFVPSWAGYLAPRSAPAPANAIRTRYLDARGWPMLAAWGGFEVERRRSNTSLVEHFVASRHAVVMPSHIDGEFVGRLSRVIPLAPIWRGFAVNTLFYACMWAVLLLLLLGPGVTWRTVRNLRQRCIHCGYPAGRSDVCTECGRPFHHRGRAAL